MPAPARLPLQQKEALAYAYKTVSQAYCRAARELEAAGEIHVSLEMRKQSRKAASLQRRHERTVLFHVQRDERERRRSNPN